MRCFERMLRRAALPVRQSQGFHPKPRLIFALSLPLGVIGCEEVAELELDEILPLEEVRDRLVRQAPLGMEILSLRRIDFKAGAQIHSLTYRIALPPDRTAEASRCAAELMAVTESFVERTRPTPRRVNLRRWLLELEVVGDDAISLSERASAAYSLPPCGGGLGGGGMTSATSPPTPTLPRKGGGGRKQTMNSIRPFGNEIVSHSGRYSAPKRC